MDSSSSLGVTFTDSEKTFYSELFQTLDLDKSGKIATNHALALFQRSLLPNDVVEKIVESSGCHRLGHFGRSQFFVALKLIAAAQVGLPLTSDTFKNNQLPTTIPLPKFASPASCVQVPPANNTNHGFVTVIKQQYSGDVLNQLPPPPSVATRRMSGGSNGNSSSNSTTSTINKYNNGVTSIRIVTPPANVASLPLAPPPIARQPSEDKLLSSDVIEDELELNENVHHEPVSQLHARPHQRRNRVNLTMSASSSPEPGVSPQTLAEQGWQSFDGQDDKWQEEGRLLIEPGDDDEDDHNSDDDEEDTSDIWSMSRDQQDYYKLQFQSLVAASSCLSNKLSGSDVRKYFEKSKLPVNELADIWSLSDIDRDGALSLVEFSIAMHLIVLRRKASIQVPASLPKSLVTAALKISSRNETPANNNLIDDVPPPPNFGHLGHKPQFGPESKEWTKFTDSPTTRAKAKISTSNPLQAISNPVVNPVQDLVSNPIVSPESNGVVNFDFKPSSLESNPAIVHPVALRLTPEGQCLIATESNCINSAPTNRVCPIPPRKISGAGLIPPPLPLPRQSNRSSGHARSSSLDLNKLDTTSTRRSYFNGQLYHSHQIQAPEQVSMSPSNLNVGVNDDHHGAFSVYRKATNDQNSVPATKGVTTVSKGEDTVTLSENYKRTLEMIQTEFSLEPVPIIPSNPCDINDLKRCLKLSSDRVNQLEQINQILMEKLAETLDKNFVLELQLTKVLTKQFVSKQLVSKPSPGVVNVPPALPPKNAAMATSSMVSEVTKI